MGAHRPGPDQPGGQLPGLLVLALAGDRHRQSAQGAELADIEHAEIVGFRDFDPGRQVQLMAEGDIVDHQGQQEGGAPYRADARRQGDHRAESVKGALGARGHRVRRIEQGRAVEGDLDQDHQADPARQQPQGFGNLPIGDLAEEGRAGAGRDVQPQAILRRAEGYVDHQRANGIIERQRPRKKQGRADRLPRFKMKGRRYPVDAVEKHGCRMLSCRLHR